MSDALLQSIVDVVRATLGARAASILLLDEAAGELVFAAVSQEGGAGLVGRRIPADTGLAGSVLASGQALVVEDVAQDPRFAGDRLDLGYVPKGLMSAPLLAGERAIGVLQVLDRPRRPGFSLLELELLGRFAEQAVLAVELGRRVAAGGGLPPEVERLRAALGGLTPERRQAVLDVVGAVGRMLDHPEAPRD
ncbi:MAG: hypothetical protein AVDCRST_MAG13-2386 [uncultured Solirubrobacteraceae bacterium]|uniref:GAF domain-containing protein n=1 Tax=uncultured Solirubrobacteraceae bacterium TaxID=1162706 RepID=A0A6J4SRI4_9ACTN|nr:MAG: hypothetical protein AVDCRST_MAG13-2386 [uncultured Solirubrobacteraceae bacterium]